MRVVYLVYPLIACVVFNRILLLSLLCIPNALLFGQVAPFYLQYDAGSGSSIYGTTILEYNGQTHIVATYDADPTLNSNNAVYIRIDAQGNVLSSTEFDASLFDYCMRLIPRHDDQLMGVLSGSSNNSSIDDRVTNLLQLNPQNGQVTSAYKRLRYSPQPGINRFLAPKDAIFVEPEDSYYIAGDVSVSGNSSTAQGNYLLKLDANGNILWDVVNASGAQGTRQVQIVRQNTTGDVLMLKHNLGPTPQTQLTTINTTGNITDSKVLNGGSFEPQQVFSTGANTFVAVGGLQTNGQNWPGVIGFDKTGTVLFAKQYVYNGNQTFASSSEAVLNSNGNIVFHIDNNVQSILMEIDPQTGDLQSATRIELPGTFDVGQWPQ